MRRRKRGFARGDISSLSPQAVGRGTTRRGVEGLVAAGVQDMTEDALGISPQLERGDPQNPISALANPFVAPRVPRRIPPHVMRNTIYLDHQLRGGTVEIEHERTRRMLVAELQARGPRPQ